MFALYFLIYGFAVWFTFRLRADTSEAYALGVDAQSLLAPAVRCIDAAPHLVAQATLAVSASSAYLLLMPGCLACALCCLWNSRSPASRTPGPRGGSPPARGGSPPAYPTFAALGGGPLGGGALGLAGSAFGLVASCFSRPAAAKDAGFGRSQQPMV